MPKPLPSDDFRAVRIVLEPEDYALHSDEPDSSPRDLILDEVWRHLTVLPDEAAVRTSNQHGTLIATLSQLAGTWTVCIGDREPQDLIGLSMIEVINELDASLYTMLVGFYRQAIDSLRIVFESVTIGAYCHLTAQDTTLQDWLNGASQVKFRDAATGLQGAPETTRLNEHLIRTAHSGFADQADRSKSYAGGWLRQLYEKLSRYSHGRPLYNNVGLWQSNGPIYVGRVVAIVSGLFVEILIASYILVKLCRPDFELPAEAKEILATEALHLPDWAQVSAAAREAYQFTFSSALLVDL